MLGQPVGHPPQLGVQHLAVGDVALERLLVAHGDSLDGELEAPRIDAARPVAQQPADLAG